MRPPQNRFPQQLEQPQPPPPAQPRQQRRKRWGGCWGGSSCFGKQKGGKRIVPSSRIPEGNGLSNQPNGPQAVGLTNQATTLAPSLMAPPSSPASFSNSALPSTAQSPSCFLSMSANSPGGPSSTMFTTGPYAHETQLVSPPVFSTVTTEPSTAPLTPPPELAHLTTPSSPDVPFAQFLSSGVNLKRADKSNYLSANDLQAAYSLYPGSPASSLISPVSRTSGNCLSSSFHDREFRGHWDPAISSQDTKHPRSNSGGLSGPDMPNGSKLSHDSNLFCPATFAQFYDQSLIPHAGGRLSVSKESDAYTHGGTELQNRPNKPCKQDVEEIEAYRASFGFSADEIVATTQYVEISDVMEDSFTMMPFISDKPHTEGNVFTAPADDGAKAYKRNTNSMSPKHCKSEVDHVYGGGCNGPEDHLSRKQTGDFSGKSTSGNHIILSDADIFSRMGGSRSSRKCNIGLSCSDAEIDYRRGRSLRERQKKFGMA